MAAKASGGVSNMAANKAVNGSLNTAAHKTVGGAANLWSPPRTLGLGANGGEFSAIVSRYVDANYRGGQGMVGGGGPQLMTLGELRQK